MTDIDMTKFKKILSIILAVVIIAGVWSMGFFEGANWG